MADVRRRWVAQLGALIVLLGVSTVRPADAAIKPRPVLVVPFDAGALGPDERWVGEAIAQIVSLGLAQHPAFVQYERARVRAIGQPEAWGEAAVIQAARSLRADVAAFGQVTRTGSELTIRPRLVEMKPSGPEVMVMEPITIPDGELINRIATLPVAYARTMKVALSDGEAARLEKAGRPTGSARALELFARSELAVRRGGQEALESAADLLGRATEADSNFVIAQYELGTVHAALGNRWKAAAQFRASTQLDPLYPEPYKALGDLFMAAPRRLFDQAVEAYQKAIELRPFYGDAHVGLGEAKAAKGDTDGAIAAYQKALTFNPINARVYISLGKIYYEEKSLYFEAVNSYKRAIDLDPTSIEARMGLGEIDEDKGLYKEAIEEYRRVIAIDDKHTKALYNLAVVYEKVDPREAIAHWERYIAAASQLQAEKDGVDTAQQHLRKLKRQVKD
jgi:tetratricopeptide (TPR) repeat protein